MIHLVRRYRPLMSLILLLGLLQGPIVNAEPAISGEGGVGFTGEIPKTPVDPERPSKPVGPGPGPSTDGPLRIDFASSFDLGRNKITTTNRRFYANAQLFHDDTPPRGNYIQVTDQRPGRKGWALQMRQEHQFKSTSQGEGHELKGAVFTFDHGWANSAYTAEPAPTVIRDTIEINEIGTTYNLAIAEAGSGRGTWVIEFGASASNESNQASTLFKKTDEEGKPLLDHTFGNQPVYGNRAVSLKVPDTTTIQPVHYQTVITWVLSELPNI